MGGELPSVATEVRGRHKDGSIVWKGTLPARTNAPLTIAGDMLITAASYPAEAGQRAQIVAYRLTGEG